jgi:tellurite resistance protein TehA-like permease
VQLAIRRATNEVQPEAGAAVMATGIVSVALHALGQHALSGALLAITAGLWAALVAVLLSRVALDGGRARRDARALPSLTAGAGTAVLGSRLVLLGWYWSGWPLLVICALLLVLLRRGLRAASRSSAGAGFLIVVAPQSSVVLATQLARRQHVAWLALASLALFAISVAAYAIALRRFELGALRTGRGEQWIAGGALAISALACAQLAQAGAPAHTLRDIHAELRIASVVLWALAIAWLPVLIVAEVRWPRLAYNVRRWSTVFPVGTYAAMSFAVARVIGDHAIDKLAQAWTWVALGVWAAVAAGALRHLASAAHRAPAPSRPQT